MYKSQLQKTLYKKLPIKLSQIGFALNADLIITDRIPEIEFGIDLNLFKLLQEDEKVFIASYMSIDYNKIVQILKEKDIKVNFYLANEPNVDPKIIKTLLPVANQIFCQNNNFYHPKVHYMPIGIRDCGTIVPLHSGFYHNYLIKEGYDIRNKDFLCLLCFQVHPHLKDRVECYELFKDSHFILNLNKGTYSNPTPLCWNVPVEINYEYTHKSKYTLCPGGCGEDTHRFFESIYLGSIPIVKRTNTSFDRVFEKFPCLVIDNWSDITEELLLNNLDKCTKLLQEFKSKYPNIFYDIDDNLLSLMLSL